MTKYQRLFTNDYKLSTKDYVRNYQKNMQNKANFRNTEIGVNPFLTSKYEKNGHLVDWKNKANSNPIFTLDISSPALEFILGCAYLFFCRGSGAKPIKPKTNPIQTQSHRVWPNFATVSVAKIGKPLYHYQIRKIKNISTGGTNSNEQIN